MSKSKKKRRSPNEKLRIVMKGIESGVEVSTVCRQEGISPTQYYAGLSSRNQRFEVSQMTTH
jgi:transposase-like protein